MADPQELLLMRRTAAAGRTTARSADPHPGRSTQVPTAAPSTGSRRVPRRHEDPELARAMLGDPDAGQRMMAAAIARLGTAERAHRQLMLLQDAARGAGDEMMALVRVPLVEHGGAVISLSSGALPDLIAACESHHADLQVAAVGPSFQGLAVDHVPQARIAELEQLARRFGPSGSAGPRDLSRLQGDVEQLIRLVHGIGRLDPMSAASLRRVGQLMAATMHAAMRARGGDELDVHHPGGIPLEEYEERQARYLEAGDLIRGGMFANLTFTLQLTMNGDRDAAARAAGQAAMLDDLAGALAGTLEGAAAARRPAPRDRAGYRLPEATVVGVGDPPARPEPEFVPPRREPTSEERAIQRRLDHDQMMEHARRGSGGRR